MRSKEVSTLAGEPETTEAPATGFPAIAALSNELTRYQQANTEVSVLEAKLSRLERDEFEVLNDIGSDEEAQCKRLSEVRIRKDVQATRTAHQRGVVGKALGMLEEAYGPAEVELSAAQSLELTRRQELLLERAKGLLGLTAEDWEAEGFLFRAVGGSPFLTALRACTPNQNAHLVSVEQRASDLIELADKLQAEIGRKL
jgi:hypothetical protein